MDKIDQALVISIEGGEGAGKSTVIEKIAAYFEELGRTFIITREPGGVRISEKIRDIILEKAYSEMDARTEAMLFAAARRQHLIEKVIPALNANKIVIFDRFVDSSLVYQGYVRGIGIDEVYDLNLFATEGFLPNLTLYLDVDPELGLKRISSNPDREVNKIDLEGLEFHLKVREGYQLLLEKYPDRIVKIDANQGLPYVVDSIIKQIEQRL